MIKTYFRYLLCLALAPVFSLQAQIGLSPNNVQNASAETIKSKVEKVSGQPVPTPQKVPGWNWQPLLSNMGKSNTVSQAKGGNSLMTQAQCVDTLRYPLAKTTGLNLVIPISVPSLYTGVGQWFPAPQSLSVTGFEFWGYVAAATSASVTLTGSIWEADSVGNPSVLLGTGTTTVDSNTYGYNLVLLRKEIIFSVPATTTKDYVITITTTSNTPVHILANDWNANDGQSEDLSSIQFNNQWLSVLALGANCDYLMHPYVVYNLIPSFTVDQSPTCPGVNVDFNNVGGPWSQSKFYNINAFFNQPELSYTWDYGDGSPTFNGINASHTYTGPGSFVANLKDTVNMWTGTCQDQVSSSVQVNNGTPTAPAFTYTTTGMQATFTDATTGSPTLWSWDFGDGSGTSTSQNPNYTYAANGIYNVCLTTTNSCGNITTCQNIIIGTIPASSCDTLTNAFGTPTIYSDVNGGYVGGQNSTGTTELAEKISNMGNFGVGEIRYLFDAKKGVNGFVATVWDDDGPNNTPGTILGQVPVPYSAIDTTGLTVAVFNPPINANGDFFVGCVLSTVAGDTIGLISNADGQSIPATAWEKSGGTTWQTTSIGWALEISWGIDVVEKVNSDFAFNVTNFNTTFTDQSSGSNGWFWDFGDGNTSTAQNPTHTYGSTGTFTVCLTSMNSTCNDTSCQLVTICPEPQANFAFVPGGLTVLFQDASQFTPTAWLWSFGDGNTSSQQNPVHQYASNGTYTVCLIANNSCGADTICLPINTNCSAPTASFTVSTNNYDATFTDTSPSAQQWLWTFGDGNSSTSQNPMHTYGATGTYQVCLAIQDSCGLDSSCQMVTITCPIPTANWSNVTNNLTVNFTDMATGSPTGYLWDFGDGNTSTQASPTHIYSTVQPYTVCQIVSNVCGNDTLCKTIPTGCSTPTVSFGYTSTGLSASFTDSTSPTPTAWFWNFGDGATDTVQNPNHQYMNQGTYTVCLTATDTCGTDSACMTVNIICPQPTAGFVYVKNGLQVNFTDAAQGSPASYAWDFGDSLGTDTVASPTYTYNAPGTYVVCQIVADSCGPDTSCQTIIVSCPPPIPNFSFVGSGLNVTFTDLTVGATSWTWTFGDGNVDTVQNPVHGYSSQGTYTVCLIAADVCGADTFCQSVNVICPLPTPNFNVTTNNFTAAFTDTSGGSPISWAWDFGDGNFNNVQNPTHTYGNTGIFNVCLTISDSCGTDTACKTVSITCPTPIAGFGKTQNELQVTFTDTSQNGPQNFTWDFGDGNSSAQQHPIHTYQSPGTYQVCLTVNSVCGSDQICQTIIVTCLPPSPAFTFTTTGNMINVTDQSGKNPTSWNWTFGDGQNSNQQNPTHTYDSVGTYTLCLYASSQCGMDSLCQQVVITCVPPAANFTSSVTDSIANFQNLASQNSLTWNWDFGDSTFSSVQNPAPHTYKAPGTYTVCLYVTNTCGNDTFCNTVTITCQMPTSAFTVSSAGPVATFTDASIIPLSWFWEFGDGDTAHSQSPTHAYTNTGTYQVCLTVTNFCGTNKSCQTVVVNCLPPTPAFSTTQGAGLVNFTDGSINNPTKWLWDFGDGTTDTVQNPSHSYIFQGIFTVCLKATNSCGSNDTCKPVLVTQINVEDEFGSGFEVWPNPTAGDVMISGMLDQATTLEFEVTNALGQVLEVQKVNFSPGIFKQDVNLSNYAKGVYTITVRSEEGSMVRKIIRE